MRKQNPNDVVRDFQSSVDRAMADWGALRAAIGAVTGPLAKRATVDAFTRIAVDFESFRSDWHIAAINRDSGALQILLSDYVDRLLSDGNYPALKPHVRVELPKHPSLELVRDLLDPQRGNLSLSSYEAWKKRAGKDLCDPYKNVIATIRSDDRKVVDAVIKIRNVLAHQSPRASEAMNLSLVAFDARDVELKRGTRDVRPSGLGSYLNAIVPPGSTRLDIYTSRLRDLAGRMVV